MYQIVSKDVVFNMKKMFQNEDVVTTKTPELVEDADVVITKHGNKLNFICDVCSCEFSVSAKFCERIQTNKDTDDLDFLTDEEKIIIINEVLDDISEEIKKMSDQFRALDWSTVLVPIGKVIKIIDNYKA